jgi:2-dehydro-3-deoxygluconokinase
MPARSRRFRALSAEREEAVTAGRCGSMPEKVICLGEAMGEIAFDPRGQPQISVGGDVFNTACYLARGGVPVTFASCVGTDPFGQMVRGVLAENCVSNELLTRSEAANTGIYAISNDPDGERHFHYWRENSAARNAFADAAWAAALEEARCLYLSGISLYVFRNDFSRLFAVLETVRKRGGRVFFDRNYRPRLWAGAEDVARSHFTRVTALSNIVFPTLDDEVLLYGPAEPEVVAKRIAATGAGMVVLKRGAEGCLIREGRHVLCVPVPERGRSAGGPADPLRQRTSAKYGPLLRRRLAA